MEALQYPIGKFDPPTEISDAQLKKYIDDIHYLPQLIELAVQNLDEFQLQTPYRPGGWTVAQVVHHLPDSHMNAYIRMKLALTEENPDIKPYEEQLWAELPEVTVTPVNVSITLLYALHKRWVNTFESLTAADWNKTFRHPANGTTQNLKTHAANYSWHGRHHLEHILKLKERMGW
ncbi:putative metal-dependent hydrolase [Chitinophaga silvatica]|uniref:Putative metal-dependent hydrolase n=1 Tax=Chitinophaga silvatica TaxID=2282649 RepID=A0A3E1YGG7_9BACT|nr:putative metal-dependent hydrolase [Chitinophaga silvatica]RFS26464.1 putative metal-dependent hydrolase [Chitinophaga silvatica]